MSEILVDSNVILDLFSDDPAWAEWSERVLGRLGAANTLLINHVIYTEISIGFRRIEELDAAIDLAGFRMAEMPKAALFLAGKVFVQYRKKQGTKTSPLPDFFIGAHAAVLGIDLLTRDVGRYRTYFPTLTLITP